MNWAQVKYLAKEAVERQKSLFRHQKMNINSRHPVHIRFKVKNHPEIQENIPE